MKIAWLSHTQRFFEMTITSSQSVAVDRYFWLKIGSSIQACQGMACDRTRTRPHTTVFIYACYRRTCKTLYDELIVRQHFTKYAQLSFSK